MAEPNRPGTTRVLRRSTLRARMTLLYGAVICVSGVALVTITSPLVPGMGLHQEDSRTTGPGSAQSGPGAVPGGQHIPFVGTRGFWENVAGLVIIAALSLTAGWLIAGRFVRPLRTIITTARDISASDLHRRLGVRGRGDEFTELGQTLDELFGRLEASFQAQRIFVANASHELRTPLSAGRALLQVAITDPEPTVDTLRATCQKLIQLGDQQERLIGALLTLANSQRGIDQLACLDLADITRDALLDRQNEVDSHGIHLNTTLAAAPTTGDRSLIESLIGNLVDNAIRHNLPGGQVEISTARTPAGAVISISNTGMTIPPDALEDLFQPFRRLGTQRVRPGQGHGLGLAIVRAIANAHGATLTARARPHGGLDIEVTFCGEAFASDPTPEAHSRRTRQAPIHPADKPGQTTDPCDEAPSGNRMGSSA